MLSTSNMPNHSKPLSVSLSLAPLIISEPENSVHNIIHPLLYYYFLVQMKWVGMIQRNKRLSVMQRVEWIKISALRHLYMSCEKSAWDALMAFLFDIRGSSSHHLGRQRLLLSSFYWAPEWSRGCTQSFSPNKILL